MKQIRKPTQQFSTHRPSPRKTRPRTPTITLNEKESRALLWAIEEQPQHFRGASWISRKLIAGGRRAEIIRTINELLEMKEKAEWIAVFLIELQSSFLAKVSRTGNLERYKQERRQLLKEANLSAVEAWIETAPHLDVTSRNLLHSKLESDPRFQRLEFLEGAEEVIKTSNARRISDMKRSGILRSVFDRAVDDTKTFTLCRLHRHLKEIEKKTNRRSYSLLLGFYTKLLSEMFRNEWPTPKAAKDAIRGAADRLEPVR